MADENVTPTPPEEGKTEAPTPSPAPTDPLAQFRNDLKAAGVSPEATAVLEGQEFTDAKQLAGTTYDQFVAMGIKAKSARILADKFGAQPAATSAPAPVMTGNMFTALLPVPPEDESFLRALQAGGTLKIDKVSITSAMRAALAARVGMFELPEEILKRMEAFSESLDETVGQEFLDLHKEVTKRRNPEILAALGVSGTYLNQRRKDETLERLNQELWPTLSGFQVQLAGWVDAWVKTGMNPLALMATLRPGTGPTPLITPPDTGPIVSASQGVIDKVNHIFRGAGMLAAQALAFDAAKIRELLENKSLATNMGFSNREQMLKALGAAVSPDYVRIEQSVTTYALAVVGLPSVTAERIYDYLQALNQLGTSIPWDQLTNPTPKEDRPGRSGSAFRDSSRPTF